MSVLRPIARIPTSGARAVEAVRLDGRRLLVIPQLAVDVDGAPPELDGGDSDSADVLLVSLDAGISTVGRLPVPGAEDAESFRIGNRSFLAIANIRAGNGPYVYGQPQRIYEYVDGQFVVAQTIDAFAAKQWRHFRIDGRDFLALAQGVTLPPYVADNKPSTIYEWTGVEFIPFQEVPSGWGYNWHAFTIDGTPHLAYADHVRPSLLMRWTGTRFDQVQELTSSGGRAFAHFEADGELYLLVATLTHDSHLMRWHDGTFVDHQRLPGPGAREFTVLRVDGRLFVVRVDFVTGTQQHPVVALESVVYGWRSGGLSVLEAFETSGATDVTSWTHDQHSYVAVSNSLDADVRFSAHTDVYRFDGGRS